MKALNCKYTCPTHPPTYILAKALLPGEPFSENKFCNFEIISILWGEWKEKGKAEDNLVGMFLVVVASSQPFLVLSEGPPIRETGVPISTLFQNGNTSTAFWGLLVIHTFIWIRSIWRLGRWLGVGLRPRGIPGIRRLVGVGEEWERQIFTSKCYV